MVLREEKAILANTSPAAKVLTEWTPTSLISSSTIASAVAWRDKSNFLEQIEAQQDTCRCLALILPSGALCAVHSLLRMLAGSVDLNYWQTISTPIITAKLVQDDSKTSARVVKAKIEKTTLGQVKGIRRYFLRCAAVLPTFSFVTKSFNLRHSPLGVAAPEEVLNAVYSCKENLYYGASEIFRRLLIAA